MLGLSGVYNAPINDMLHQPHLGHGRCDMCTCGYKAALWVGHGGLGRSIIVDDTVSTVLTVPLLTHFISLLCTISTASYKYSM